MPTFSRKRKSRMTYSRSARRRPNPFKYPKRKTLFARRPRTQFARKVMSAINRHAEVKSQPARLADYTEIKHNQVQNIYDNAFRTKVGTVGEGGIYTPADSDFANGSRLGKAIYLKGVKVALNIQQSQKRPLVKYNIYLVRNKLVPDSTINDKNEMFEGYSSTIPMDYIDTDKVHIMFSKQITVRMPNKATAKDMVDPSGLANQNEIGPDDVSIPVRAYNGADKSVYTNPQHFSKFYVPVNKKIIYRDYADSALMAQHPIGSQKYQWVITAYDNHDTDRNQGIVADQVLGHLKMTTIMKYTDV